MVQKRPRAGVLDFDDVVDQELAKRAMVIAAAGEARMLMIGPSRGGPMLARRLPTTSSPARR